MHLCYGEMINCPMAGEHGCHIDKFHCYPAGRNAKWISRVARKAIAEGVGRCGRCARRTTSGRWQYPGGEKIGCIDEGSSSEQGYVLLLLGKSWGNDIEMEEMAIRRHTGTVESESGTRKSRRSSEEAEKEQRQLGVGQKQIRERGKFFGQPCPAFEEQISEESRRWSSSLTTVH